MVVDDSSTARAMLMKLLAGHPSIDVVAVAMSGPQAMDFLQNNDIEILLLDVEMPETGGLQLLPQILLVKPDIKVIMVSSFTTEFADITIAALTMGASDYVPKPEIHEKNGVERFQHDLVEKICMLGEAKRHRKAAVETAVQEHITPIEKGEVGRHYHARGQSYPLRDYPQHQAIGALAIAASTGGPQALIHIFKQFDHRPPSYPIFITQHLPEKFPQFLANHIQKRSGLSCVEARDREPVKDGVIYIASGRAHLGVTRQANQHYVTLMHTPAENYCLPSADPMLRSLAKTYKAELFVIILTGMGHDGFHGAEAVVQEGGVVIAQDEASSVVWGMPKHVIAAGLCTDVMALDKIAEWLKQMEMRG